ncbi:unnamed protein product, partial [Mesorhabditis spiculigera]
MRLLVQSGVLLLALFAGCLADDTKPHLEDELRPGCKGHHSWESPLPVSLVFLVDRSAGDVKASKTSFFYSTIACVLPAEAKLMLIDLPMREAPVWTDSKGLRLALNGSAPISKASFGDDVRNVHLILVTDQEELERHPDCDIRKHFSSFAHRLGSVDPLRVHLDTILVGSERKLPGKRATIPAWTTIFEKFGEKQYVREDSYKEKRYGDVVDEFSAYIDKIFTETRLVNDVLIGGRKGGEADGTDRHHHHAQQ